jgi:phage tail-like protein
MPTGLPNVSNNDAIAARNFAIEVDGTTIAQFTELSGLTSEIEVTELKENGPDGKLIIKKIPSNPKPPTITLKRAKNVSMELHKWHELAKSGKIKEARKNGSIILYDFVNGEVARWNFVNAWPSKLSISSLKAGSNDVVTEEATIVTESCERVK